LKLGYPIISEVLDPLRFSNLDYIQAGSGLSFFGTGLSTDEAVARQLLENDSFGTTRVAIVRDIFDRDYDRQFLSSVLKLVGKDTAVLLDIVSGPENLKRRLVTEYSKGADNKYHISKYDIELSVYLTSIGYKIISFPIVLYKKPGLDLVNLGSGSILHN
jgi:hypothetical protein